MNPNTTIQKNLFTYSLITNNKVLKRKLRPLAKVLIIFVLVLIAAIAIWRTNFTTSSRGFNLFLVSLRHIFEPFNTSTYIEQTNLWLLSLKFLWLSIKVTFVGTVLGLLMAMFTALIGNLRTNNKFQSYFIRLFILFLRSFPELVYLYLFTVSVDGQLASILLISWFSWIWLHKFISEAIENVPADIYSRLLKQGYSKAHIIFRFIYPSIKNKIVIFSLYSFESNLRWTAVFSTLGVVGIGQLFNFANENLFNMHQLLIPLLVLVIFISVLEWASYYVNNYLLVAKSKIVTTKNFENLKTKKTLKNIFTNLLIVAIFITAFGLLFTINNPRIYPQAVRGILNDLFNPNWAIITKNENLVLMIVDLFLEIYLTVILATFLALINLAFTNQKTNNVFVMHTLRFASTFIRIIPTIVIFFTIGLIFKKPAAAFVISFAIHSSTVMAKQLNESIAKISKNHIISLKRKGYSNFRIFNQYIIPYIKMSFSTFIILEVEKNIRNFINYGLFGASTFGLAMVYTERTSYKDITPYVWISMLLIIFSNVLLNYIKNKRILRKQTSLFGFLKTNKSIKNVYPTKK